MQTFDKTIFQNKIHLSVKGRRKANGKFDWTEATCDSALITGITLCTGLGSLAASNAINANSLIILVTAVVAEFLGFLAAKRGLIQKNTC
jgi:hypothetical protein